MAKQGRTYKAGPASTVIGGLVQLEVIPNRVADRGRPHYVELTRAETQELMADLQHWLDYFDASPERAAAQGW